MKRRSNIALSVILLVFSSHTLFPQKRLKFEKLSPMINEAYGFAYGGSEDKAYALTGGDDAFNYSSVLQVYYTKLDTWTGAILDKVPLMNFGSSIFMPNYNGLVLLGGTRPYGSSVVLNEKIRMLNLDDNSIIDLGELPYPARNMGLAKEGNTIYFFGGSTQATPRFVCSNKLFSYDMAKGHLEELTDMPMPMETQGAIVNGNLYAIGGYDQVALTGVHKYNLNSKEWTTLEPLRSPLSNTAVVQHDRFIIMVGDFVKTNQLLVYDTETDKRHYFKMNFKGRFLGASIIGDHLYVYGGLVPSPSYYVKRETYRIQVSDIIMSL